MIGLDTNILLRWLMDDALSRDDAPHQAALVEALAANADEEFFINQIVLVETAWVLKRRAHVAKDALVTILGRLLNTGNILFQDREILLSALASYARYPGDFSDHLIGTINEQSGCRTTLTFDKAAARSPQFSELQR